MGQQMVIALRIVQFSEMNTWLQSRKTKKGKGKKMGRPTEKMTDFAEKISDLLGVEPDDWDDFESVSEFISEYKEDYFDALRDNK